LTDHLWLTVLLAWWDVGVEMQLAANDASARTATDLGETSPSIEVRIFHHPFHTKVCALVCALPVESRFFPPK